VPRAEALAREPRLLTHHRPPSVGADDEIGANLLRPEVSEGVGVRFEDRDTDAGTSQEKSQHHAGRSAARHHALDVHGRESVRLTAL
jgi:hypothetical protein